jgi:hypothetical protein
MPASFFNTQTPVDRRNVINNWFVLFDKKGNPVDCVSQVKLWSIFSQRAIVGDEKIGGSVNNQTELSPAVDDRVMHLLSPLKRNAIDEFRRQVEATDLPELILMALVDNKLKNALITHVEESYWKLVRKGRGKTLRKYWRKLKPKPHFLEALLYMHLKSHEITELAEKQPEFVISVLLKLSKLHPEVFSGLIFRLHPTEILANLTYQSEALHRAILQCEDDKLLARWSEESAELGPAVDKVHSFNRVAGNALFKSIYETYKAGGSDDVRYARQLEQILRFQKFDIFRELLTVKLAGIVKCMECNIAVPNQEDIQQVIELAERATELFATLGHLLAVETYAHLAKYFSMQGDNETASRYECTVKEHLISARKSELTPLSQQVMLAWCKTTNLSVAFKLGYVQLLITNIQFENWAKFTAEINTRLGQAIVYRCR